MHEQDTVLVYSVIVNNKPLSVLTATGCGILVKSELGE